MNNEIKISLVWATILVSLLAIVFILSSQFRIRDHSTPSEVATLLFPEVSIEAKAAYVYDLRTQTVLFAKNEELSLPLASLTKIMSAVVAEDISSLSGTVIITKEALRAEGDNGLYQDEKWSLKNLLDFSLITSSNDGMRAVALSLGALSRSDASSEEILDDFVKKMNYKAAELNLKNTYFWNETGLDESEIKGGAYGTARDITALMEHILAFYPELLEATRQSSATLESLDNFSHTATNTNSAVGVIPGLLGSKTGFTDTAGGNLTFAFDPELGRPIIVTVLGSTEQGRFDDAYKLVFATLKYLKGE